MVLTIIDVRFDVISVLAFNPINTAFALKSDVRLI